MPPEPKTSLPPYSVSLAGSLLAAREAVMAPLRPWLRAANITEQQWRVLRVLDDSGALDAKSIAEQALLYPPTVTRILKELTDRQLLGRESDPEDGRRSVISITATGRKLVADTARHTGQILATYREAFGEERLTAFIAEALALARTLDVLAPGQGVSPGE